MEKYILPGKEGTYKFMLFELNNDAYLRFGSQRQEDAPDGVFLEADISAEYNPILQLLKSLKKKLALKVLLKKEAALLLSGVKRYCSTAKAVITASLTKPRLKKQSRAWKKNIKLILISVNFYLKTQQRKCKGHLYEKLRISRMQRTCNIQPCLVYEGFSGQYNWLY